MIGNKIKLLRKRKNLTQAQLASDIGININTLASYESEAREPKIDTIIQFANYFSVTTDFLLDYSDIENLKDYNATNSSKQNILEGISFWSQEEQQVFAYGFKNLIEQINAINCDEALKGCAVKTLSKVITVFFIILEEANECLVVADLAGALGDYLSDYVKLTTSFIDNENSTVQDQDFLSNAAQTLYMISNSRSRCDRFNGFANDKVKNIENDITELIKAIDHYIEKKRNEPVEITDVREKQDEKGES